MIYLTEFIIFAFIGWVVDSVGLSFEHKKLIISGYVKGIPLCPIYGFGGIILINTFALMSQYHYALTIMVSTFLIVALEFFGGWFAEHYLGEKLWNYSDEFINLHGHISIEHSFIWLSSVMFVYILIGTKITTILKLANSYLAINPLLEIFIIFIVIVTYLILVTETKKHRHLRMLQ